MRTRGEGVKESENFVDIISESPQRRLPWESRNCQSNTDGGRDGRRVLSQCGELPLHHHIFSAEEARTMADEMRESTYKTDVTHLLADVCCIVTGCGHKYQFVCLCLTYCK